MSNYFRPSYFSAPRVQTMNRQNQPLTNDQLRAFAPSIFATEPWHAMSEKYAFIPTIQVVDKMRAEGFQPVAVTQGRTRVPGKGDFTKHLIRFRDMRNGEAPAIRQLGQIFPELVLTNSHDGASAYKLDAGLYRLVCMNGMVVADSTVGAISVRHTGAADAVIDASYEVIEQFPKVLDSVERFQALRLNEGQRMAYAEAALTLRYDENEAPIAAPRLLEARRSEDRDATLWNTFNTVQETLTNGGVRGRGTTGRRLTTRPVTGIAENTKLNKALWTLTEKMRELVS